MKLKIINLYSTCRGFCSKKIPPVSYTPSVSIDHPYRNEKRSKPPFYLLKGDTHTPQSVRDEGQSSTDPAVMPTKQRSINVGLVGLPNAGKSSVINAICRKPICPYSQRTHTTKKANRVILTSDDVQVVLFDTPGVVKQWECHKFKLSEDVAYGAGRTCSQMDLICVVHDVSSRFTREALDKSVLKLLMKYHNIPSFLVLNKVDSLSENRSRHHLIRKLTCNHINEKQSATREIKAKSKQTLESYMRCKEEQNDRLAPPDPSLSSTILPSTSSHAKLKVNPLSVSQFMNKVREVRLTDAATNFASSLDILRTDTPYDDLISGVVGWPAFTDVFSVSAVTGVGVGHLLSQLKRRALLRRWMYEPHFHTNVNKETLILNTVKAKIMEVMSTDIPYGLRPRIDTFDEESSGDLIRILISLPVHSNRVMSALLMHESLNMLTIARLVEQDLTSLLGVKTIVNLNIDVMFKQNKRKLLSASQSESNR